MWTLCTKPISSMNKLHFVPHAIRKEVGIKIHSNGHITHTYALGGVVCNLIFHTLGGLFVRSPHFFYYETQLGIIFRTVWLYDKQGLIFGRKHLNSSHRYIRPNRYAWWIKQLTNYYDNQIKRTEIHISKVVERYKMKLRPLIVIFLVP